MSSPFRPVAAVALLFFLFAFSSAAYAEDRTIVLTEDVQLKIADAFMAEGEYYRAVTEYKKFLILFPDTERADYALFNMGAAYYRGEEYASATRTLGSLQEKYPVSGNAIQARLLEGFCYWKLKQYEKARALFDVLADTHSESEYAPLALAASSLVALDEDIVGASRQNLERFVARYPEHAALSNVKEAMALIDEYRELPQKSPLLAGVMSAIIPGSGYMYAGHYGDAVTAFLINGLFIAGTITGISQENYAVAGIVGGIGLPFYFGNIYGSANAAKKWNRGVREELRQKIHAALSPLVESYPRL
jgi:outer membrane protein assembly factor BamD (BamD/ComL family)/TM2 domain-containing membrane protein YozV